ncbi:hypothetical protein [Klebsiella phage vB_KvaP_F4M1D]|nr:hypothetical protein [Klebsiella phage vB_KvaP_F4M1D]
MTSTKLWIQNTYSRKPRATFGSPFLVLGLSNTLDKLIVASIEQTLRRRRL